MHLVLCARLVPNPWVCADGEVRSFDAEDHCLSMRTFHYRVDRILLSGETSGRVLSIRSTFDWHWRLAWKSVSMLKPLEQPSVAMQANNCPAVDCHSVWHGATDDAYVRGLYIVPAVTDRTGDEEHQLYC